MKKYLLVCVLAIFAVSAQAASFKQSDIKAKPKANVSVSDVAMNLPVPTSAEVTACNKEAMNMRVAYNATNLKCVTARINEFNNAELSNLGKICAIYGFTDFNSCLAPGAIDAKIKAKCEELSGLAALNAKVAECKQLASSLSAACKQVQSDVEKLVAEQKAALEALKKDWGAYQSISRKLAEKSKYIKDNKCPAEMQIPDAVLKDPVISNGKISAPEYIPPKIK